MNGIDVQMIYDAQRKTMTKIFENGSRVVTRCRSVKNKYPNEYRQKPEHGRGKGKTRKQWDVR